MTSFLSTNHITPPLDGILPKPLPLYIDRCHTTSTNVKGDAEEAQEAKPSKAYAVGGLLPEVERGMVAAAAAVVVVEAVVAEVVGLEAFQTFLLEVRPTPASLRSSSS